jgi:lycopene cyclase domain-containing protein
VNYWGLNAIFLAVVVIVAVVARLHVRKLFLAGLILLISTAIFDNLMISIGLVGYDTTKISGAFIGIAPLEDFAYPLAAIVLLPALWMLLGPRKAAIK